MSEPEILKVEWSELEAWLRTLCDQREFDGVVGIARSGLPIAVALSFLRPDTTLAVLSRIAPRGAKLGFYDFDADRKARIDSLRDAFELTRFTRKPKKLLVVDDVATLGDTLLVAREKILQEIPDVEIAFACYAVDMTRLTKANPEIFDKTSFAISIDNQKTWVSYPWNFDPIT